MAVLKCVNNLQVFLLPHPFPDLISMKKLPTFSLFVFLASIAFSNTLHAQTYSFDFSAKPGAKSTAVKANAVYSAEAGYGFENSAQVTTTSNGVSSTKPFLFSVAVPEGNYRVKLTLGDADEASETTVKAETRRLMLEKVQTKKGERIERSFVVNVRRPGIAGGGEVKLKPRETGEEQFTWDDKLTLEFNGPRPSLDAIDIERIDNLPTLYLLGDSTVTDQPGEPYASWGQMLPRFFSSDVSVANYAQSGESLASSKSARRLDKVLSLVKPYDYVFIQFGHNDMKAVDVATYKNNLKIYTAALAEKRAQVILVTQVQRRTFEGGTISNSHKGYPDAVREVAREEGLPLIDLHAMSKVFYEALGPEKSLLAFKPGDGTHHNAYGAYELAKCIVEGVRQAKLPLAKSILADVGSFDPAKPDALESFSIPASPAMVSIKKPDGS
ncbi:rhamnogalacturonan acetylesterase [Undibacterium sp. Ji49W]|uniref:rhamnogalacturonan acetylesterase n=1 Tax=Undibacterium sp. Ji49W TaxID=3413040 RepID=UPI003BF5B5D3